MWTKPFTPSFWGLGFKLQSLFIVNLAFSSHPTLGFNFLLWHYNFNFLRNGVKEKMSLFFLFLFCFLSFHAPLFFTKLKTPSEWEDVTEQLSLDNEEEEKDWDKNNLEDLAYLKR